MRNPGSTLALAATLVAAPACSLAEDFTVKTGGYVGLMFGSQTVGGEFDDTLVLSSPSMAVDVPRVNAGRGMGIVLGTRTVGGGGFELTIQRSRHKTSSVLLGENDATYAALDLDGKWGLVTEGPWRAWWLLGIGFVTLRVEDSATEGSTLEAAKFSGASINFGIGGAYYFTPTFGLQLDIGRRQARFATVNGIDIDDGLKAPGRIARLAAIWSF